MTDIGKAARTAMYDAIKSSSPAPERIIAFLAAMITDKMWQAAAQAVALRIRDLHLEDGHEHAAEAIDALLEVEQ